MSGLYYFAFRHNGTEYHTVKLNYYNCYGHEIGCMYITPDTVGFYKEVYFYFKIVN